MRPSSRPSSSSPASTASRPSARRSPSALANTKKAFQTSFNKLLDVTKAPPKPPDVQGVKIYDFDVPNVPNAGAGGLNIEGPISVAITKGNLFLSTEPTLLEQVLRSGGNSLADSP